jgi:hypothetical protein
VRTFWIIIALLGLAAAWFFWARDPAAPRAPAPVPRPVLAVVPEPVPATPAEPVAIELSPSESAASDAPPPDDEELPIVEVTEPAPLVIEPEPEPAVEDHPQDDAARAPQSETAETPAASIADEPTEPISDPEPVLAAPAPEPAPEPPPDSRPVPIPGVDERDDGSFLVADRFVVTGKGTPREPYVISWDMLVAVAQSYQPRQGRRDLPPWLDLVSGRHVRIEGYTLFPLVSNEADECLLMRSAWDGCCIGVPPTPYDGVEVRLAQPVDLRRGVVSYASVRGRLKVEPYLAGEWLLGLYVMEGAVLEEVLGARGQTR